MTHSSTAVDFDTSVLASESMGKLVAVCGIDGAGKSTLVSNLSFGSHHAVDIVKKNVTSSISLHLNRPKHMDTELQDWSDGPFAHWAAITTVLDFLEHYETKIAPKIRTGNFLVCDRYWPCYQAYLIATGAPIPDLPWAEGFVQPTLNVLIDVPVEIAVERQWNRGGPSADETVDVLTKFKAAYHSLVENSPDQWVVIDNTQPFADSARLLHEVLLTALFPETRYE